MAKPLIRSKEDINAFNLNMKSQPWYQDWMRSQGINPGRVKLSKEQRKQLEQVVLAHGAPVTLFNDMMIDPAGNLNTEHGFASQPTWLKAIEIGGAGAIGGYLAAPLFGGTTAATGVAGAGTNIASMTIPELGLEAIPSILGAGGTSAALAPAVVAGGGTLGKIGGFLKKAAPVLTGAGQAVGAATSAAGQTQLANAELGLNANAQNISGESAFQNAQQGMAATEAAQRKEALKNIYRANYARNPSVSPFNPVGAPKYSPEYLQGLTDLEKEALARLASPALYGTDKLRAPVPYTPYVPNTRQSTMQRVGNWLSPALSMASSSRR